MPRGILLLVLACASSAPVRADVVINEALPAPRADWNGNGVPSEVKDEWVELANPTDTAVDLSGMYLAGVEDAATPRTGLDGTLAPGDWLFVTGEQALDWQSQHGGSGGLALSDERGAIALYRNVAGAQARVDWASWDSAPTDVSFGRWPDGTGELQTFDALAEGGSGPQPTPGGPNGGEAAPKILEASHDPVVPTETDPIRVTALAADADGIADVVLWLRLNGGPLEALPMARVDGAAERGTWEGVVPAQPAGTSLQWFVASDGRASRARTGDVARGRGAVAVSRERFGRSAPDPNGGTRTATASGSSDSSWRSSTSSLPADYVVPRIPSVRHTFPAGLVLGPHEMYVVFGGGTPTGIPSGAAVASTGTLSLNNTADTVRLQDASSVMQDSHAYGAEANADQSLIRLPDGDGAWTRPHDAGFTWNYSPGVPNSAPSAVSPSSWAEIKAVYKPER
jgi:hypothetical protein